MTEELAVNIKNIVYSEDYKLADHNGYMLDYSICDIDLP